MPFVSARHALFRVVGWQIPASPLRRLRDGLALVGDGFNMAKADIARHQRSEQFCAIAGVI